MKMERRKQKCSWIQKVYRLFWLELVLDWYIVNNCHVYIYRSRHS